MNEINGELEINGALMGVGTGMSLNTSGTALGSWPYDYNDSISQIQYYVYPWWPQTIEKEVEPKSCMGKAHVFECDHEPTCKCGTVKRVMPKLKKAKKR